MGIDGQDFLDLLESLVLPAKSPQGEIQSDPGFSEVGVYLDRFVELLYRFAQIILAQVRFSKFAPDICEAWCRIPGLLQVADRSVDVPVRLRYLSKVDQGLGVTGLEFDRLREEISGPLGIALAQVGYAQGRVYARAGSSREIPSFEHVNRIVIVTQTQHQVTG